MKKANPPSDANEVEGEDLVEVEGEYGRINPVVAKIVLSTLVYDLAFDHQDELAEKIKEACEALCWQHTPTKKELKKAVPYFFELVRQIDNCEILYFDMDEKSLGKIKVSGIPQVVKDIKREKLT